MGGTTSDIALVKNNLPIRADNGIQIGSWRTFVKGLYVDTFGLGGDSEICYHESELFLSDRVSCRCASWRISTRIFSGS